MPGRSQVDEKQITRAEAIINSMTTKERLNSSIINGSHRKRTRMSKMFETMGSGGGMGKMQQRLMSQMGGGQRFGR